MENKTIIYVIMRENEDGALPVKAFFSKQIALEYCTNKNESPGRFDTHTYQELGVE